MKFAHLLGLSAKTEKDDDKEAPEDELEAVEPAEATDDNDEDDRKEGDEKDDDEKDDDEEMRGDGPVASVRKRERERCAAIFAAPSAAGRPDIAATLAFNTSLSRKEAISVLDSIAEGAVTVTKAKGLVERMAELKPIKAGGDAEAPDPSSPKGIAAMIMAAAAKARGKA